MNWARATLSHHHCQAANCGQKLVTVLLTGMRMLWSQPPQPLSLSPVSVSHPGPVTWPVTSQVGGWWSLPGSPASQLICLNTQWCFNCHLDTNHISLRPCQAVEYINIQPRQQDLLGICGNKFQAMMFPRGQRKECYVSTNTAWWSSITTEVRLVDTAEHTGCQCLLWQTVPISVIGGPHPRPPPKKRVKWKPREQRAEGAPGAQWPGRVSSGWDRAESRLRGERGDVIRPGTELAKSYVSCDKCVTQLSVHCTSPSHPHNTREQITHELHTEKWLGMV